MSICVFPNLRSRCFASLAEIERLKGMVSAMTMNCSRLRPSRAKTEIKNPQRKKTAEGLHRHLAWMRALCEVDQKFLASLDLQRVTAALLETVVRGGEFRVCTELGKGSTFTIILPVG